ncbi:uncharacterized protein [Montipora foliosa]|uniref:uncharacterized protein n=1 Tax=Montipora foliosa TaxID=591990 RepID=UPI0035F17C0C
MNVDNVCKAASFGIRNIGRIHKYIVKAESERLVHAFVSSKLDYCNSILYGLQDYQLKKLQRIQNTAPRVVCKSKIKDHISPVLEEFHWLPVKYRIVFKILLFIYKAINGLAPTYINLDLPPRTYYLFLAPERPPMVTVPYQLLAQYYGTLCQLR